jgi:hypothetical protein
MPLLMTALTIACGHGPLTPEDSEAGVPEGGAAQPGSDGGATPTSKKPCNEANGRCACFVHSGGDGCCITAKVPLSSQTNGDSVRIFDPSNGTGRLNDTDTDCHKANCSSSTSDNGVILDCRGQTSVECGCDP